MSNRQVGLESLFGISQQGNFKTVTLEPQKGQPLLLRVTYIVSDSDEVPGHLYPLPLSWSYPPHMASQLGSGSLLWLLVKNYSFISR